MTFNKSATLEKPLTGSKTKRNRSKKKKKEVTGKYKIRLVRRVNEKIVDPPYKKVCYWRQSNHCFYYINIGDQHRTTSHTFVIDFVMSGNLVQNARKLRTV